MFDAKFTFMQTGYTNYIIVEAFKPDSPLVIEGVPQVFGMPPPAYVNILYPLPETGTYKFAFYESVDGVTKGFRVALFSYDVEMGIVTNEIRFYIGGGGEAGDPIVDGDQIIDPYLDGKTISKVFKETFRFLRPGIEWNTIPGGGVQLIGFTIGSLEVISVEIDYLVNQFGTTIGGAFDGIKIITANTTIDNTYTNKRVKCETPGSAQLIVTLAAIASIAEGRPMYFTSHNGFQIQTRFLTQPGELIIWCGLFLSEITIGKGEALWIEKRGANYEVINEVSGMLEVGDDVEIRYVNRPNVLPYDGRLLDGDNYPRLWWWINNMLPVLHRIAVADATLINAGYVHPVGQEGMYAVSTTTKKFRLPNAQNWFKRGLKSFTVYGTDGERSFDYPGGSQLDMFKAHSHNVTPDDKPGRSDNANDRDVMLPGGNGRAIPTSTVGGVETRGKNIGVIMGVKI